VADPGGGPGGPGPPIFGKVNLIFFTLYTMSEKKFLKLNLDFIVAAEEFLEVWGCMRHVCVNRNRGRYCFLFSKGPILNDIRGHSDPKIYVRLQEIASNF